MLADVTPVTTIARMSAEAPYDYGVGRTCAICGKELNRYHADVICYPCEYQRTEMILDRQRNSAGIMLHVERAFLSEEDQPFFEPDAFQMWADAMYGSVTRLGRMAGLNISWLGKQWRTGRLSKTYSQAVKNLLLSEVG